MLAWNASISSVQDIPGIVWTLVLEPLPPVFYARHAKTNALGLTGRQSKSLLVLELSITWSKSKDDGKIEKAARTLIETTQKEVGRLGKLDQFLYLNYAAPWQKPIYSYGEANVEKLLKVREEYDPLHTFTDYVPGGFKLPGNRFKTIRSK